MTKQTDRLLTLELNQRVIKEDVTEIKALLKSYIHEAQNGRVSCNRQMASTETQTRLQWGLMSIIIGAIVALFVKR